MGPSTPIASIESRLADIRARVDPRRSAMHPLMSAAAPIVAPEPLDFEPFGEVYQAAVAGATPTNPAASGATSTGAAVAAVAAHGGGCIHCVALSATGPVGPTVDPTAVPTGASIGKVGGFGRLGPPPELEAYGNGQIPAHALAEIGQGGHRLYAPAAAAWRALVDAAAADGIEMRITDSYRSYDQQVDLVRRKGLYSEGGLGATPGTSNHGWGLAVDADVNDPRTLEWIRANGWRFGFVEAVPREPWHWEFRPHQA